jgi:hypothetical protein
MQCGCFPSKKQSHMKTIGLCTLLIAMATTGIAQLTVNKSIPVAAGQKLKIHFDYPELVKISTWDKNEINIQGTVLINGGENDDAFVLNTGTEGQTITVKNEIKDMKNLPHRITVKDGAQTLVFRDKAALRKYQQENGRAEFERMSWGVDMDIVLEIKVPHNMGTEIESVYGMVEVSNFTGPLTVRATYGGVDAALMERSIGAVTAETRYGEIYSNLEAQFGSDIGKHEAFHTLVQAKPGNGPSYTFESKYGNVYLRKAN